jgi:hypothetical protein
MRIDPVLLYKTDPVSKNDLKLRIIRAGFVTRVRGSLDILGGFGSPDFIMHYKVSAKERKLSD